MIHMHIALDAGWRGNHNAIHLIAIVKLRAKHNIAYIIERNHPKELICLPLHHWKEIALRTPHHLNQFAERHVGVDLIKVRLDHIVDAHHRENRLILAVGHQFALLRQAERVDAVRHEDADRPVGADSDQHEWQEQVVAPR